MSLAALKDFAAQPGLRSMIKDLRAGGQLVGQTSWPLPAGAPNSCTPPQRRMSWTRLRREAGVHAPAPAPDDPPQARTEGELLRRIGYVQHVADSVRVGRWSGWLRSDASPDLSTFSTVDHRLATQLFHVLAMRPGSWDEGFANIWQFPAVRSELLELLQLERADLDAVPVALTALTDTPLRAHARYTRAEVFAALGVSTVDSPKEHREGVYFIDSSSTQLMFVTLDKDSRMYSPSIQYKDHSISPELFHWESPNSWRQSGPAMLSCLGEGKRPSAHRLLFVRESRTGAVTSTFRFFGEVDRAGALDGERPVAVTWRLRQPLPERIFEATRLVAAG